MLKLFGLKTRLASPAPFVAPPPGVEEALWVGLTNSVVKAGLTKMLRTKKWFCICDLQATLDAAGIIPNGDVLRLLRPLHCMEWADMEPDLRNQVQAIIVKMFEDGKA